MEKSITNLGKARTNLVNPKRTKKTCQLLLKSSSYGCFISIFSGLPFLSLILFLILILTLFLILPFLLLSFERIGSSSYSSLFLF